MTYHCGGVWGSLDTLNHQGDHASPPHFVPFLASLAFTVSHSSVVLVSVSFTGIGSLSPVLRALGCPFRVASTAKLTLIQGEITGYCLAYHYAVRYNVRINLCMFFIRMGVRFQTTLDFRTNKNRSLQEHMIIIPVFILSNRPFISREWSSHSKHWHFLSQGHGLDIPDSRAVP